MNSTTKFYKNLQEATLYLTLPLGLTCLISGLLYINQISMKNSWLVNRTIDTPFFMVLTLYLFSKVKLIQLQSSEKPQSKFTQILELTLLIGAIAALILFDIFFTNKIPT